MEERFEIEQWVTDTKLQVNSGLPVQIIKIEGYLVQVWFPKGEDAVATEDFLSINDIKVCD